MQLFLALTLVVPRCGHYYTTVIVAFSAINEAHDLLLHQEQLPAELLEVGSLLSHSYLLSMYIARSTQPSATGNVVLFVQGTDD